MTEPKQSDKPDTDTPLLAEVWVVVGQFDGSPTPEFVAPWRQAAMEHAAEMSENEENVALCGPFRVARYVLPTALPELQRTTQSDATYTEKKNDVIWFGAVSGLRTINAAGQAPDQAETPPATQHTSAPAAPAEGPTPSSGDPFTAWWSEHGVRESYAYGWAMDAWKAATAAARSAIGHSDNALREFVATMAREYGPEAGEAARNAAQAWLVTTSTVSTTGTSDTERLNWMQANLTLIRDIGWLHNQDLREAIDLSRSATQERK